MSRWKSVAVGEKYNSLLIINLLSHRDRRKCFIWECRCDCGETAFASTNELLTGKRKKCDKCYFRDSLKIHLKIKNKRIKRIYIGMVKRCNREDCKLFVNYGGRGIAICEEWLLNPTQFEEWSLKNGYSDNLSIDRIDNDGNYEPDNCRWATTIEQMNNTRGNKNITYNNETLTQIQWSRKLGVNKKTIAGRKASGEVDFDRIFSTSTLQGGIENRSGETGVSWNNQRLIWIVRFMYSGKIIFLGQFKDLKNALLSKRIYMKIQIKADEAAILRGDFYEIITLLT